MLKNIRKNLTFAAVLLLSSAASHAATVNGFANGGFETGTAFAADSWAGAARAIAFRAIVIPEGVR